MQKKLPELLRLAEGEQLGFKQRISSAEKIARTLCAFANTRGGILLVGVKDDHTITGIDPEEEKFMLEQAATAYCQPQVLLHYEEIEDDEERVVLLVQIEESEAKPHSCRNHQGDWQVYVRLRDKSIPAGNYMSRSLAKGVHLADASSLSLTKYEAGVLKFIEMHERINLKQLMLLLNFSKRRAQRLLQSMLQKGLVRQFEHEKEPYYA